MKRLLLLLTATALASACSDGGMTAPTPTAYASNIGPLALADGEFVDGSVVPDCALFTKGARRVLSTSPAGFVLRMEYETALPAPYFKAINLATGGLLYQGPFGDIAIRVSPGQYAIGLWVEVVSDRLYSCHVGTLSVSVPKVEPQPPDPGTGGTISDGAHLVPSGQEVEFFVGNVLAPAQVHATVQWSLGDCQGKVCANHGLRRLRIRLDGVLVAEVSVDGREDFVTKLTATAAVGPGRLTVSGLHVTTLNGAGVSVWAILEGVE